MKKKLYTMEAFRKGGLAVTIRNDRELEKFLGMCKKNGIHWNSGAIATDFHPKEC